MKKFQFLGAIAFALLLSLNANVLLDGNNWESGIEEAKAQMSIRVKMSGTIVRITQDAKRKRYPCPPNPAGLTHFWGCVVNNGTTCHGTGC